ncbi:MAG TPA: 50S ribosomal protein P1 [Candidatus Pacearchaeota archaeon]|nr:50S ribosomal protein P1 [Candidatus Pacearchaeota archaeon]
MEYMYAALLLHKLGKEINEENLRKVMEAAGATVDESRLKVVVTSLKGVDIEKVLKEAKPTQVEVAKEKEKEEAKEEEKEEKKEESVEGLAALFG